jgi:hypothetical protein
MSHIYRRAPTRNKTNDSPDLFSWQPVVVLCPVSRAGSHVMRRFRVAPHIAELIAGFAGLGGSEER